ncbi:MAG: deaminase [Candidatus Dojkabacteria bacterium]|nr:deaminase [Candidatus Dojkabacteria bacterium]
MKRFINRLVKENKISVDDSEFARDMLREAYLYAFNESTDSSTKTGAVIVLDGKIISRGTNKFAENVEITKKRNTSESKVLYQDHSERNAVYNAAKLGIPLDNAEMFTTWIPCPACANAIMNSSINRVIFHYGMAIKTRRDWRSQMQESIKMMLESGVKISVYMEKIGECKALFKGKIWEP